MVSSDSPVRLQIYILISGLAFFIFANLVPTMSAIRRWLAVSFIITFTYVLILLVILVRDGRYLLLLLFLFLFLIQVQFMHESYFIEFLNEKISFFLII